ncbi:MAG: hypothetical protein GF383_10105 [Candidatus Lokiarchaeota archaeon]|nr:hypothetical protein [Candidatus Lokiarchaeota archaeon]MBD3340893.1 hypothetical protein [Candidatus Lokiarchaeota archaeon]
MMISVYQELEEEISKRVQLLLKKYSNLTVKRIIKEIYKDINNVFYVDKEQIEYTLKSLIKSKQIMLTVDKTEDSLNFVVDRKSIFYYIDDNPGKTLEELCKELNLTKNQMIWHLTFLKRIRYIQEVRKNNQITYYPNNLNY